MQDNKKILILKHGALGDIIQGFDAFASVRTSFPTADISLLTSSAFAPLLTNSGWFDEVLIDNRAPFWKVSAHLALARILHRNWDIVLDFQCSKRTANYAKFKSVNTKWFGISKNATDKLPDFTGVNNADRMLITAEQAGVSRLQAKMDWLISGELPASAQTLQGHKYGVLFAGCSLAKPQKRWPAEGFIELANSLLKAGIRPVLAGTAQDRDANNAVLDKCPEALDVTAKTNLTALAALCAQASCVIGNDTGPVFLAAKCGTPTVMVMGGDTDPLMSAPKGSQASYIKADNIKTIQAEQVLQKLQNLGVLYP